MPQKDGKNLSSQPTGVCSILKALSSQIAPAQVAALRVHGEF
jgi:hypothetical protein